MLGKAAILIGALGIGSLGLSESALHAVELERQADSLRVDGSWEEAAILYERALGHDPGLAPARLKLGHCYDRLGLEGKAASAYRQALPSFEEDHRLVRECRKRLERLERDGH